MPLLTDADFILDELDTRLFPGLPEGIKVHNGFGEAHAECVPMWLASSANVDPEHSCL